jgi:hypothetical protein
MGGGCGIDNVGAGAGADDKVLSGKLDWVVNILGHGCDGIVKWSDVWSDVYGGGIEIGYEGSTGIIGEAP